MKLDSWQKMIYIRGLKQLIGDVRWSARSKRALPYLLRDAERAERELDALQKKNKKT